MFIDPEFWRQLDTRLTEKREDLITKLIRGQAAADYRETVAEIRMLEFVRTEAEDIIQKMHSKHEEHN